MASQPQDSASGGSNVVDLMAALAARRSPDDFAIRQVSSRRHARRKEPAIFRVRIHLDEVHPPIWRLVDIRSDVTLDVVHDVLQVTMGWTNSHLHQFSSGPVRHHKLTENYLMDTMVEEGDSPGVPEVEVRLDEVLQRTGDRLYYEYDFGDSWEHTLTVQDVLPVRHDGLVAVCINGSRACPPEDSGGIYGYQNLLSALSHPSSQDAAMLRAWAGESFDPEHFSVAEVNNQLDNWRALPNGLATLADPGYGVPEGLAELLRRVHGSVVSEMIRLAELAALATEPAIEPAIAASMVLPYQWMLDRLGVNGLELTSAGYLKPVDVQACMTELGMDELWIGKNNRESQTYPVLDLRTSAQKLGLIRKFRGRLVRTAVGKKLIGNPVALWHHLATRVPAGEEIEREAGLITLLMLAAEFSPDGWRPDHSLDVYLAALGWGRSAHVPITRIQADLAADPTTTILRRLGALPDGWRRGREPLQVAGGIAFARAALRAH